MTAALTGGTEGATVTQAFADITGGSSGRGTAGGVGGAVRQPTRTCRGRPRRHRSGPSRPEPWRMSAAQHRRCPARPGGLDRQPGVSAEDPFRRRASARRGPGRSPAMSDPCGLSRSGPNRMQDGRGTPVHPWKRRGESGSALPSTSSAIEPDRSMGGFVRIRTQDDRGVPARHKGSAAAIRAALPSARGLDAGQASRGPAAGRNGVNGRGEVARAPNFGDGAAMAATHPGSVGRDAGITERRRSRPAAANAARPRSPGDPQVPSARGMARA